MRNSSPRVSWTEKHFQWLLLVPAGILFGFLTVFPLLYNVYISLHDYNLIRRIFHFIGIENYRFLMDDPLFINSVSVTVRFMLTATVVEVVLGLGLALLFRARFFGSRFALPVAVLPMMLPTMVIVAVWRMFFDHEFGLLNSWLTAIGLPALRWLSDPNMALNSVVLVDVWQWTPFVLLVLLAGMQSIPDSLYEAAQLDGAAGWSMFRHITLPLLLPHLQVVVLLRAIDTFRVFDKVYALTGGGPGHYTETVTLFIYKEGFRHFDIGYASAASLVMVVMMLVLAIAYIVRIGGERT